MSNLTQLNTNLFELFNQVKDKSMDLDRARVLNATASTIINNAKTQLDALKLSEKIGMVPSDILPVIEKTNPINKAINAGSITKMQVANRLPEIKTPRELLIEMDNFAVKIGYTDRLDAMRALKEKGFEVLFNNRNKTS
jgi:hypothetical protein